MQYTPRDILNYVYEKVLDTQFLLVTANHVQDFSIGEITDKKIEKRGEDFYLVSKSYHLDIKITDDEVLTAAIKCTCHLRIDLCNFTFSINIICIDIPEIHVAVL